MSAKLAPVALEPVTFTVVGNPRQQGSKTLIGKALVDANAERLRPWRAAVTDAALAHRKAVPYDGPLALTLTFRLPRPGTHKADDWCSVQPDFDKLARAVCDALTDAKMIVDDARIAHCVIDKRYVTAADDVGVTIELGQLW